jgi:hypothetical protein
MQASLEDETVNLREKSSSKAGLYMMIAFLLVVAGVVWWKESNAFGVTHSNPAGKKMTASRKLIAGETESVNDVDVINVKSFGARGDGEHNDTAAIQAAINAAGGKSKTVLIPPGEYKIDAVQSLTLKSGITLQMTPDTILRVIPNSAARYALFTVNGVENVRILGGILIGDRKQHFGITGEWGMGIRITGAKNILVQGTTCNEFWGDGLYIGETTAGKPSENIRLIEIKADRNRRQGLSLISGKNIEIADASFTNTNGTAPAAGMDIEPNNPRNVLENIIIRGLTTAGNQGAGIIISSGALAGTPYPVGISILNHRDEGSDRGMQISTKGIIPGEVLIDHPEWKNTRRNAIAIQGHDHRSFHIQINAAEITDVNQSRPGAAIDIYSFKDSSPNENGGIGNVSVNSPVIADTRVNPKTVSAFYIWDIPGHRIRRLSISNPVLKGNLTKLSLQNNIHEYVNYTQK